MRDTTSSQKTFPSRKLSAFQALLEWEVAAPSGASMSLPVSSYEELLARVRFLRDETIQLERELISTNPLLQPSNAAATATTLAAVDVNDNGPVVTTSSATCDNARRGPPAVWPATVPLATNITSHRGGGGVPTHGQPWQRDATLLQNGGGVGVAGGAAGDEYSVAGFLARLRLALDGATPRLDKERADEPKEEDDGRKSAESQGKSSDEERGAATPGSERDTADDSADAKSCASAGSLGSHGSGAGGGGGGGLAGLYHGTWPVEHALWHSGPPSAAARSSLNQDLASVMSFSSSASAGAGALGGEAGGGAVGAGRQQLGAKVEMVYGLLSMLGAHDRDDMSRTLLTMSTSPDACLAMRKSGCLPLLVQLLHGGEQTPETRRRAAQALHNVVHAAASAAASACPSSSSPASAAACAGSPLPPSAAAPDEHRAAEDKRARREARVLKLLEQARDYCDRLRERLRRRHRRRRHRRQRRRSGASGSGTASSASTPVTPSGPDDDADQDEDVDMEGDEDDTEEQNGHSCDSDEMNSKMDEEEEQPPVPTVAALMKLSFDEEHRHAMCELGGLHAIAELIQMNHEAHGSTSSNQNCIILRRYAGMALTNLTFGDSNNKALLCSFQDFMRALVAQLSSPSEDLRQVTASVLRNLSWKADSASKQTLREVGAVSALVHAAMEAKKESTLKSILSALWNLSAHCSINKVDICAVEGSLGFFVDMLSYQAPSKSLAIIENAGGILRNVSSHIAMREDYRAILRQHKCLQVLLQQLKSPSLTIVSNACGTLWNLSAQCAEDQRTLWEMGAVSMLRSLVRSKHKMISMGSSAALKNLLSARPDNTFTITQDTVACRMGLSPLPSLHARRQRALEQELDQSLAETCDNIEPSTSPNQSFSEKQYHSAERRHSRLLHRSSAHHRGHVTRSDSRDSVTSTHSDSVYERVSRNVMDVYTYGQASPSGDILPLLSTSETSHISALHSSLTDAGRLHTTVVNENTSSELRFLRRYVNSMKEREERKKVLPLNISCEDNERQSSTEHESFQRSRLRQIDEGTSSDRRNRSPEVHLESTIECQRQKPETLKKTVESDEIRLSTNVQLDVMSLSPASPAKQNNGATRTVNQRSTFSPIVTTTYSGSSRTQYQQGQNSSVFTRNKYSDLGFEETESQEQPVDYSRKYVEHPVTTHNSVEASGSERTSTNEPVYSGVSMRSETYKHTKKQDGKQNQNDLGHCYAYKPPISNGVNSSKNMKMNVVYGDYAETDLDQPTDYSLQYPEEDEEDFQKDRGAQRPGRPYCESPDPLHEDTLKTYCTEGTPYETPYNFSTATSMSDLNVEPPTPHEDDIKEEDEENEETTQSDTGAATNVVKSKNEQIDDEKASAESEEKLGKEEDAENLNSECMDKDPQMKPLPPSIPRPPVKGLQSGLSSGLMSPDKPVQYCEEGTPGCFSRVSSLSSLHSGVGISTESQEHTGQDSPPSQLPGPGQSPEEPPSNKDVAPGIVEELKEEPRVDREVCKVVTFGGADHYAEETPLMFSRCSSLGSLSSFEQHSIHDDRSSIVSDFSRRTSGVISPSELPDSPTQTVPSSPRHQSKAPGPSGGFTSQLPEESEAIRSTPVGPTRHQAGHSSGAKASVFEDDVATFKEESTPVEFSTTTSLSSLTIDDEPKICNDAVLKEGILKPQLRPSPVVVTHRNGSVASCSNSISEDGMEKQDIEKEKRELSDCCELAPVSEGEEENDEDMLAACISIGMQNSRHRQSQQNSSASKVPIRGQSTARHFVHSGPLNRGGRPSGIPVKVSQGAFSPQTWCNQTPRLQRMNHRAESSRTSSKSMNLMEVPGGGACEDALQTYYTEGTPANISHAGSHSDLSVLSLPGDCHETEISDSEIVPPPLSQEKAVQEEAGAAPGEKEEEELDSCEPERPELSDDSSNFSGDGDNILAECIQSGMPKARPQLARRSLPQPGCIVKSLQLVEQEKHTVPLSATPTQPQTSRQPTIVPQPSRSHHLCGIDHGPPRQPVPIRRPVTTRPRVNPAHRIVQDHGKSSSAPVALPQCTGARDEMETYATEGSPKTFSTRSSLSDLTINSSEQGATASCPRRSLLGRPAIESCDTPLRYATEDTPLDVSHAASLNSLSICEDEDDFHREDTRPASGASSVHSPIPHVLNTSEQTSEGDMLEAPPCPQLMMASDGSWADRSERHEDSNTSPRPLNKNSSASEDMVTVLSRNGSLSSLSVDSFGSTEPTPSEQALLEQCISSGMPKSKTDMNCSKGSRIAVSVLKKKGVSSKLPLSSLATSDSHHNSHEDPIPSPIPKLDLRPSSRHSRDLSNLESEITNLSLQDEARSSGVNVPKNGVDLSAVVSATMNTAADTNESIIIAAATSITNITTTTTTTTTYISNNHNYYTSTPITTIKATGNDLSLDVRADLRNVSDFHAHVATDPPAIEASYLGNSEDLLVVNSLTLENGSKVLEIDLKEQPVPDYVRQTSSSLYESATMTVTEELYKRQPSIYDDSPKVKKLIPKGEVLSPESTTQDSKSPLSSGESPSSDFVSEGDLSKKKEGSDIMIASLDQITEELVAGQKEKGEGALMKQSLVGGDTWNEDDISFPSISISGQMVGSFKSDDKDDEAAIPELIEEEVPGPAPLETSMTESNHIEMEAERIAGEMKTEVEEMNHSVNSLNSVDLDNIKPPSMMGSVLSLTTSLSGHVEHESIDTKDNCQSVSVLQTQNRSDCKPSRKKSLPVGVMVRRALGNSHNRSVENIFENSSSSCISLIDNVKPPSAMEEVIDVVDMENSMVSVASITSEVADSSGKDQSNSEPSASNSDALFDLLKPAAIGVAELYAAHITSQNLSASLKTSSASDNLDNVNPPSLLNEMGDFTDSDSLIEPGTETICSDTELITEDPSHTYPVNSPESSFKNTPVESDQYITSSADSTPKKHQNKTRQLTPKQRRQMVKDRYRTYTIAAEQEKKAARLQMQQEMNAQQVTEETENGESPVFNSAFVDASQDHNTKPNKITAKQRRLEDPSRFQTQVLDKPVTLDIRPVTQSDTDNLTTPVVSSEIPPNSEDLKSCSSGIKKSKSLKTIKQKRAEAKDRYRTRTLSEDISKHVNRITSDDGGSHPDNIGSGLRAPSDLTPEELETLLEHDANIVINSLKERVQSDSSDVQSGDDLFIDCETLSLVSIESESEVNSSLPPKVNVVKCFGNLENVESTYNGEDQVVVESHDEIAANNFMSHSDSESSSSSEVEATKGNGRPRIVRPDESEVPPRDTSMDSLAPEEAVCNSPKGIRGRRKTLYSSPVSRKPPVQTQLPSKTSLQQSGIPRAGKILPIRSTKASNLRQTGRGATVSSPSPKSLSRTPSGGPSPASTSPKTMKGPAIRKSPRSLGTKTPSPKVKTSSPQSSSGNTSQECSNAPNVSGNTSENVTDADPKFKPPERQGTFTKDEPSAAIVAKATIPSQPPNFNPNTSAKSRIPLPSEKEDTKRNIKKKEIPKLIPHSQKQKNVQDGQTGPTKSAAAPKLTKNSVPEKAATVPPRGLQKAKTMPERRTGITRLPTTSRLSNRRSIAGGEMKTSLSNQSLKSSDSTKRSSIPALNQRSSSNCSLSSVTSGSTVATVASKKTIAKKEVTSKIASLWKKVEESKKQQNLKKDTRVWITGNAATEDSSTPPLSTERTENVEASESQA